MWQETHHLGGAVEGDAVDLGGHGVEEPVGQGDGARVGVHQALVVELPTQMPLVSQRRQVTRHEPCQKISALVTCNTDMVFSSPQTFFAERSTNHQMTNDNWRKYSVNRPQPAKPWLAHLGTVQGVAERGDARHDLLHRLVEGEHDVVAALPQDDALQTAHDVSACARPLRSKYIP